MDALASQKRHRNEDNANVEADHQACRDSKDLVGLVGLVVQQNQDSLTLIVYPQKLSQASRQLALGNVGFLGQLGQSSYRRLQV